MILAETKYRTPSLRGGLSKFSVNEKDCIFSEKGCGGGGGGSKHLDPFKITNIPDISLSDMIIKEAENGPVKIKDPKKGDILVIKDPKGDGTIIIKDPEGDTNVKDYSKVPVWVWVVAGAALVKIFK